MHSTREEKGTSLTEFVAMANGDPSSHLRATYTFELGTWIATCRACGWRLSDPSRRRAAARFRLHHKDLVTPPAPPPLALPGDLADDDLAAVLLDERR
jgi:hypothetical protein